MSLKLDDLNEIERLEEVSDFYSKGNLTNELLVDREMDFIRAVVKKPGKAIEIGCGNGYSTENLVKHFEDLIVVEPSTKNVALMKARVGKDIEVHNCLIEDFSTTKTFDQVIFFHVLEHVDDPIATLQTIKNLMTDDGVAFISVPNSTSLNRRAGIAMGLLDSFETMAPRDYEVGHRRMYTVEMLTDHIQSAGLKLEMMKGIYLKPLTESQMLDLGADVMRAFHKVGEELPHYCANLFAVVRKK